MAIKHEEVENNSRLPFYFCSGTDVQVKEHWHQGIGLNYLVHGHDLRFAIDGHTYHFDQGDMWAVNRRQIHSAIGKKENWFYFGIIIDDDYLISQFPSSKDWNLHLLGQKEAKNKAAYQKITKEMLALGKLMQQDFNDEIRLLILTHLMKIIVLLNHYFNQKIKRHLTPNSPLSEQIISFINQNFRDNLSVNDIARRFKISHVTLNGQLKQSTQMSAGAYLRLVRLMHARQLLLNTDQPIELIAQDSGFANAHILNRNFKKWKNKTPTKYRNAYQKYYE